MTIEGKIAVNNYSEEFVCATGKQLDTTIKGFRLHIEDYGDPDPENVIGKVECKGRFPTDPEGSYMLSEFIIEYLGDLGSHIVNNFNSINLTFKHH